jgi:hypothetical protein
MSVTPTVAQAVKSVGYGLPCAQCKTYYRADLKACPVCKSPERVAAIEAKKPAATSMGTPLPKSVVLDFEVPLASWQSSAESSAFSPCIREEHHQRGFAPAAICQDCYEHEQEHVLESVLNMDVKQVARIIYEAIWIDPCDPSKACQNVAHALVSEVRKPSEATRSLTLLGALTTISCRIPFQ